MRSTAVEEFSEPCLRVRRLPDCSHAGRAVEGGAPGGAGPAHLAGGGEEGVWRPRDHRGGHQKTQ